MDLNALLTVKELEAFRRHMAGSRYEDGSPEQEKAAEVGVAEMLALLVTKTGRDAAEALGPGRGSILTELIAALVGPAPDPQAWMEAIACGSFDLTRYKAYGSRPNSGAGGAPTIGSPGNFLPRLLKRFEKAAGNRRLNPGEIADLRTALGILVATTLLKELRNATNAQAALGSAWPLVRAVSDRQHAKLRRFIAGYGDDATFREHLRTDIQRSVIEWVKQHPGKVLPTNAQVDSDVPQADIEQHFALMAKAEVRKKEALVAFGKILLSGDGEYDDATVGKAIHALQGEPGWAWLRDRPKDAGPTIYPGGEPSMPTDVLHQFMPVAAGPSTLEHVLGRAALAPINIMLPQPLRLTENDTINSRLDEVARSIHDHVETKGLPPATTPIEHLAMFEASVCYWSLHPDWQARQPWEGIGFALQAPSADAEDKAYTLWKQINDRSKQAGAKSRS